MEISTNFIEYKSTLDRTRATKVSATNLVRTTYEIAITNFFYCVFRTVFVTLPTSRSRTQHPAPSGHTSLNPGMQPCLDNDEAKLLNVKMVITNTKIKFFTVILNVIFFNDVRSVCILVWRIIICIYPCIYILLSLLLE